MSKNKRPKVNFGVKPVDKTEEKQYNSEEEANYTHKAYLPVYNEERKAYDLLTIHVDIKSHATQVELEEMRFDSPMRAMMELQKRHANDYIKGGK